MPSMTPNSYFPGSQDRAMVLDHQDGFFISNDILYRFRKKVFLPAYKDNASTSPYDDEEKWVGTNQDIYLPRHELDALMLAQDVLYDIQNNHRTARMKKMERRIKIDAIVRLILRIIMVLCVLVLILFYAAYMGLKGVNVECSRPGPMGMISWCWIGKWHFG